MATAAVSSGYHHKVPNQPVTTHSNHKLSVCLSHTPLKVQEDDKIGYQLFQSLLVLKLGTTTAPVCLPYKHWNHRANGKEDFFKVGMIKKKIPDGRVDQERTDISLHFGDVKNAKIYAFITLTL